MQYIKIFLLSILFLSCQKETPRLEIKAKDYASYLKEAKTYCKKNNLNQNKFILIDLDLHSGLKRFFVYDLKKESIEKSYVVSHGCGTHMWSWTSSKENAPISNEPDSHCSSIGKYVISSRGVSQWGIKVNYLLIGKDKTNSNAVIRAIVLHSWEKITSKEVYPEGTPEGWGCPAVSNESMKEIDILLKANKNMLMWVIN
jgi:hypothetical protein